MKKFYFFVFLSLSMLVIGQSVQLYNPADNVPYPNEQYFCSGEKFNLKVDAVASSTGDYEYSRITDFTFRNPSTSVPFTNMIGDDHFSSPIAINFPFSFYGKDYNKLVVGSNGRLLFGSGTDFINLNLSRYVDQIHSGNSTASTNIPLSKAPPSTVYSQVDSNDYTRNLNLAQIFMGFTDLGYLRQSEYDKIKYGTGTYQGETGLLITFSQIMERTVGSGYQSPLDSQVLILPENKIIIKVNKTSTKKAILGIQNEHASEFVVPSHSNAAYNYNNGPWKSEGIAFLFTPGELTPVYKWTDSTGIIGGNSDTLNNFEPNNNVDFVNVEVTYFDNNGIQVGATESDRITFKKLEIPLISLPTYSATCGNAAEIHVINPDPFLKYDWYSDTDSTFHKTGTSILVGDGSYYVEVQNTAGTCSRKSLSQTVVITSVLPPFVYENLTIKECDNLGLSSKIFNLQTVTNYPSNSDYTIEYYETGNTTPITSAEINSGQIKDYKITVTTNAGVVPFCTFTKNFKISYLSFPANDTVYTSEKLCFETSSYTIQEFKNTFFPTSTFQILFSTDGINFNSNPVNPKVSNPIWVKLSEPGFSCTSIVKLNFNFNPEVLANTPTTQLPPQCSSFFTLFNLASLIPEINSENVTVTFHNSIAGAQDGSDVFVNDNSEGTKTVYIRVKDNITGCYSQIHPTITLVVYKKPNVVVATPIVKTNCAGNPIFDLTENAATLTDAQTPVTVTLEYYAPDGTRLMGNQITTYNESVSGPNPYIKVIYNTTCSDIINFTLSYNPKPVAIITEIPICTETTYSLQNFKNEVINNSSNYTFTGPSGAPLPANFNLSILPHVVKFFMKDNTTGCISDEQTVTFVKGVDSVLLTLQTDFTDCDLDFDGKLEFDLDTKKAIFTNGGLGTFEYFKDFKDDQFTQPIPAKFTNDRPFAQTVYVRITIPGFCPSKAKINLTVNTPTPIAISGDLNLCYKKDLQLSVDNFEDFSLVEWLDGKGSLLGSGKSISVKYDDVLFGQVYKVKGTNADGCGSEDSFTPSDSNQPKITKINQTNNSIEVFAEGGTKPYTYYFNDIPQSSNVLLSPTESLYVIKVESSTNCFGPPTPKPVYFIKINNAFTPNGDGKNDVWRVENLDKMEQVSIVIVNRNGTKVFESNNPTNNEWDGTHNGRALPTSTYWYAISWFDAVTQKTEQRQGWILMKNRN